MKVLLLGATGLLGHNVLISLLMRGHDVVALVRNSARLQKPHLVEEAIQQGRLRIEEDKTSNQTRDKVHSMSVLLQSARGCDSIIDCAGITDMSVLHFKDYLPVNVGLCDSLLQVMETLEIRKLVYVSTANTIGYGSVDKPGHETIDIQYPFTESWYAQSKLLAEEKLVTAARNNPHSHIVIVNPGFMVGPYDTKPSSGALLVAGYRHRFMASPRGGKSFIHVHDVAEATVNALTMGRSGERYLLTGENMSLKDFYQLQARVCNYRQSVLVLPNWLVLVAGRLGDLLRGFHIRTQLSSRNVRQLLVLEYYTNAKASDELQMPHTDIAQSIADFWRWRNGDEC